MAVMIPPAPSRRLLPVPGGGQQGGERPEGDGELAGPRELAGLRRRPVMDAAGAESAIHGVRTGP
jgi:hypothetical protein